MKIVKLVIIILATIQLSCSLDNNLFDPEELDSYKLPGNTISNDLIEEITLKSDNYQISGFWISSNGERPGISILYCHGNKHNIDEYWDRVMLLHELGVNIFIFDYRGYGKSEGESTESSLFVDSKAALEYVKNRFEYNSDSLCYYGYSLGNVASIYLASEIQSPLCLFAEAPFASANSLAQGSLVLDIQPRWLTEGEFDNVKRVKNINSHFMLFHGLNDNFVRFRDNGELVYNAAAHPKELVLINDAVHNNIPYVMGKENYLNKLKSWINSSSQK